MNPPAEPLFPPLDVRGAMRGGARPGKGKGEQEGRTRVLCIMSDTGGGHRATAEALKEATEQLQGHKVEFVVTDLWSTVSPWPLNQMPKTYSFLVKHPFLWRLNYTVFYPKFVHKPWLAAMGAIVHSRFAKAFRQHRPHLVVSVHPLMQHGPVRILNAMARRALAQRPPFATVVSDLTSCHSTWFFEGVDKCFVPTEEVRKRALDYGLKDMQVVLHGLPIRPSFAGRPPNQPKLRKKLGLDLKARTVLLVGGGEGMGKLEETAAELGSQLPPEAQLIVVCGRNQRLRKSLSSRPWNCKAHILGFVTNMHEWMGASDCIVTKAGPGTIAESLTCGLPIILSGRIPCQEEGNIPFVLDNGVGCYETEPRRIAQVAKRWLTSDAHLLPVMSRRARALSMPSATFDIARDLLDMASQCPSYYLFSGDQAPHSSPISLSPAGPTSHS